MRQVSVGLIERYGPDRPIFDPARDMLELIRVEDDAVDLRSFTFRAAGGGEFSFLPGQAITLTLPVTAEGTGITEGIPRTFTIASPPTRADTITVSVKAGAEGTATRWMHRELRPGALLKAVGPVGRFSLALRPARRIALISAGSGITPMMSMLRWLHDRGETTDVAFVHQARAPTAIPFRDELAALDRAMPNLSISLIVSRVPAGEGWSGYRGRLDRPLLTRMVPDLPRREIFCCGPHGFMDLVRAIAAAEGGAPDRFHTETFHPQGQVPSVPASLAGPVRSLVTENAFAISLGSRQFGASADDTIVEAAARSGLVIPTGCRSGLCGTCRLRLLSGQVEMKHQGGLSSKEERKGYVLACCSRPRSDLKLEPIG